MLSDRPVLVVSSIRNFFLSALKKNVEHYIRRCIGEAATRHTSHCIRYQLMKFPVVVLLVLLSVSTHAKNVTIYNDRPRLDVDGNVVDAHDGVILFHNGTFFLYGERYGNQSLATPYPWCVA